MKKKLLAAMMAAALCASSITPVCAERTHAVGNRYEDEDDDDWDDDMDEMFSSELTKYDVRTSPSKKTIRIGKSFYINVVAQADSQFEDMPDEEWDELCEENIDSITYRSSKSSVASVSSSGKVTGRRKGTALIKTEINLVNGESVVYKTKVYVTR